MRACVACAALAGALAASAASAKGVVGQWRLTVDRAGAPRVGLLDVMMTDDGGYKAYIDGGPAPIEVDGDHVVLTMDWEDGGGLRHVSMLEGDLADGALSGAQSEEDQPQGNWSAVPEVARVTGAPPAPVDLGGVWFDTTFDGTAKYTFEMTDEAKAFQAGFKPMLDDPSLRCVSDGVVRMSGGPFAQEIIQQDDRVTILYEDMHQVRRVYMDGRDFPDDVDDLYASMGYSIGHWDGSTLVVETRGLNDALWHRSGTPLSSSAHITEHYYKVDDDTMWVDLILEDPVN
jgi:hypothetical protein